MIKKILTAISGIVLMQGGAIAQPVMKFGSADLVSPAQADAYYPNQGTITGITPYDYGSPEIKDLARGLRNDPDRIYEYVRNSINVTPMFGSKKGALGTYMDMSGTPFDQAKLMVSLLEESGYTASYVYGMVTLNGAQFEEWAGISDAKAACQYLAYGGIPGSVNGASSCSTLGGSVSSVSFRHVWVQAQIDGGSYVFDPSLKMHVYSDGINTKSAMGFGNAGAMTDAAGGTPTTVNGNPAVRAFNSSAVANLMGQYAQNLINNLQSNHPGAHLEDIAGGREIKRITLPIAGQRLTSLPGHTPIATWAEIPDAYRTILEFETSAYQGVDINSAPNIQTFKFFTDRIYGRRISFDRMPTGAEAADGLPEHSVSLRIDENTVGIIGIPHVYINANAYSLDMKIDHPYAADSGIYMDQLREFEGLAFSSPVSVVLGFGDVPSNHLDMLTNEKLRSTRSLEIFSSCTDLNAAPDENDANPINHNWVTQDPLKTQIGLSWLTQFSKLLSYFPYAVNARSHHHHSFGIVASSVTTDAACGIEYNTVLGGTQLVFVTAHAPNQVPFNIIDEAQYIDVMSGISMISTDGNEQKEKAVSQSIALFGSAIEGVVFEQILDKVDTASTTERFEWANRSLPANQGSFYFNTHGSSETSLTHSLGVTSDDPLGPGAELGPYRPQGIHSGSINYRTKERGGASINIKSDLSSVGHVVTSLGQNSGEAKGGGGSRDGEENQGFDPAKVADILGDTFEDRSSLHGVNLATGALSYSPGTDISVGSGDFPYSLGFSRTFSAGSGKSRGMGAGWTHNWDYSASVSGSGMEALGQSMALNATASIVAMIAATEIYDYAFDTGTDSIKRQLTAVFVAHWWREHMTNNVVSIQQGASGTQFFRLPNGEFNGPPGSSTTLQQIGTRLQDYSYPLATSCSELCTTRRYYYDGLTYKMSSASGDTLTFKHWQEIARPGVAASKRGQGLGFPGEANYQNIPTFLATNWEFASGYEIDFAYTDSLHLESVSNTDGRKLNFQFGDFTQHGGTANNPNYGIIVEQFPSAPDATIVTGGRLLSVESEASENGQKQIVQFTYEDTPTSLVDGTFNYLGSPIEAEPANTPMLKTSVDALGQTMTYEYDYKATNSGAARRQWYPHLTKMYSPQDPNTPVMEVEYDGAWRVKKLCDARADATACQ